jgi:hypothetical protein
MQGQLSQPTTGKCDDMQHNYISNDGQTLELTSAFVTAAEDEGRIVKDEQLSTEHVTYWRKVPA